MSGGNDQYVTVIDGKPSDPLSWRDALGRAKHAGEFRGRTVELHQVRNGKTIAIVHKWKNFEQTK